MRQGTSLHEGGPILLAALAALFVLSACLPGCKGSSGPVMANLLADAGNDLQARVDQWVRLEGAAAPPYADEEGIAYSWAVLQQPHGSAALPETMDAASTRFKPDRSGTYVLSLQVHNNQGVGLPDTVVVKADYGDSDMVPLRTRVTRGDGSAASDFGIQVGPDADDDVFWAPDLDGGGATGFQVLILDRHSLEVLTDKSGAPLNRSFSTSTSKGFKALNQLLSDEIFQNYKEKALVILSGLGSLGPPENRNSALLVFLGASGDLNRTPTDGRYALLGHYYNYALGGGWEMSSYAHPEFDGDMDGYLTMAFSPGTGDTWFTFVYARHALFDTRVNGDSISVNGQVYDAPALDPGAAGGYQVLVLDRGSLDLISNTMYSTNQDSCADVLIQMGADFSALCGDSTKLIVISSLGEALASRVHGETLGQLGRSLRVLGATEESFIQGGRGGAYTFLGAFTDMKCADNLLRLGPVNVLEAFAPSTDPDAASLSLRGALTKNNKGWYTPALGDSINIPGVSLDYEVLYGVFSPPTAWPVPDPNAPDYEDQKQALEKISELLVKGTSANPNGIRDIYEVTGNIDWNGVLGYLQSHDCSEIDGVAGASCQVVWEQLKLEVGYRNEFWSVYSYLKQLLTDSNQNIVMNLDPVYQSVMDSVPEGKGTVEYILDGAEFGKAIIEMLPMLMAAEQPLDGDKLDAVTKLIGLVLSAGDFGKDFLKGENGEDMRKTVTDARAELWSEFSRTFLQGEWTLGKWFGLRVSDWGRLKSIGETIDGNPDYQWTETMPAEVVAKMTPGAKASFYQSLLPTVYKITYMPRVSFDNPYYYGYEDDEQRVTCWKTWHKEFPENAYDSRKGLDGYWYHYIFWASEFKWPEDELLDDLFGEDGLALYKPRFYTKWNFTYELPGSWENHVNCE